MLAKPKIVRAANGFSAGPKFPPGVSSASPFRIYTGFKRRDFYRIRTGASWENVLRIAKNVSIRYAPCRFWPNVLRDLLRGLSFFGRFKKKIVREVGNRYGPKGFAAGRRFPRPLLRGRFSFSDLRDPLFWGPE